MTPASPCPYGNGQFRGLSNEPLVEVRAIGLKAATGMVELLWLLLCFAVCAAARAFALCC